MKIYEGIKANRIEKKEGKKKKTGSLALF